MQAQLSVDLLSTKKQEDNDNWGIFEKTASRVAMKITINPRAISCVTEQQVPHI
uniref:Uncharacterized protein n=1 Tax=Arion vulgaris TaxID=1028688 RepID=A0A0B6YX98_9EUPU